MLNPLSLTPASIRRIRPLGWYRRQLELQAAGLNGHLDKIWPDVRDSRWIGGEREGWERVPYWLDGFIPLAWLLDDEGMQRRALRYVEAILANQEEDGWLCPCTREERARYDTWAYLLICKVLTVYYDCAGDERIPSALHRALRCLDAHLDGNTLFNWGAARWYEGLIPVFWLYERTGEEWLLDLAHKLEVQGFQYKELFDHYRDGEPRRRWSLLTHVVNLAMCLKSDALASRCKAGEDPSAFARKALSVLEKYHGMAVGHFTGDECVSGDSPVQGTELCGVVEAMYSYEWLLAVSGETEWADRLERLAFNALPAAVSEDMWTHQYLQMTNQVACRIMPEGDVLFRTNSGEAHLFGLEPNFGCCTANFGQGWPKLAGYTFLRAPDGIASAALLPAEADFAVDGAAVTCRLETDYPFRGTLAYTITTDRPVEFTFSVRIPGFAASAAVDGRPAACGGFWKTRRVWEGTTRIGVELAFDCVLTPRPRQMACLWRGPLLYSLGLEARWEKREYERDGVERRFPYCDYELSTDAPWNYAFAGGPFAVTEHPIGDIPFSFANPPVSIDAALVPVEWPFEHGACAVEPTDRRPLGPPEQKALIPYGCAKLRMTEMPAPEGTAD